METIKVPRGILETGALAELKTVEVRMTFSVPAQGKDYCFVVHNDLNDEGRLVVAHYESGRKVTSIVKTLPGDSEQILEALAIHAVTYIRDKVGEERFTQVIDAAPKYNPRKREFH